MPDANDKEKLLRVMQNLKDYSDLVNICKAIIDNKDHVTKDDIIDVFSSLVDASDTLVTSFQMSAELYMLTGNFEEKKPRYTGPKNPKLPLPWEAKCSVCGLDITQSEEGPWNHIGTGSPRCVRNPDRPSMAKLRSSQLNATPE